MIDLHIHTNNSDGSNTIEEIINQANDLGLSQFSITDHNTLKGSIEAHKLCPEKTIIGIELSVEYEGEELHMLGYFPNTSDYKNTEFIIKTGEINKRLATTEMIERLNEQGYNITLAELRNFTNGTINRVHICRALMLHEYISSVQEGFEKLVGDHCPAYVKRRYPTILEASNAVKNDGGIAVLAHPYNYKHINDIPKLLDGVVDMVDGIECFHPSATTEQSKYLLDYALSHNKKVTGGSDYHGENKPNIKLNMMNVDDKYSI